MTNPTALPRLLRPLAAISALSCLAAGGLRAEPVGFDLTGATVDYRYGFAETGPAITTFESRDPVTVGDGLELEGINFGNTDVDFSHSSVLIEFNDFSTFASTYPYFNGFIFKLDASFGLLTGVTLTDTNMADFDASRIWIEDNSVFVHLNGLSYEDDTFIHLSVEGAAAVPEPSALAVCFGVAALGFGLYRRRSRSV